MTACKELTKSTEGPKLASPPDYLTQPCHDPVLIQQPGKNKKLSQLKTENSWIVDRESLVECRDWHNELILFYKHRDSAISGSAQ